MLEKLTNNTAYFFQKFGYSNFKPFCGLIAQYTIGISEDELAKVKEVVARSQVHWRSQITETSLYVDMDSADSPYSLQYFKDGRVLIHTWTVIDSGNNRIASLCVDLTGSNFVSLSPFAVREMVMGKEMSLFSPWYGKRGLAPPFAHYFNLALRKEFLFLDHYSMNLANYLESTKPTSEDLQIMCLDLISGLVTMHADGYAHLDLKERNILVDLDANNRVKKAAICDFGECVTQKRLDSESGWSAKTLDVFLKQNIVEMRQILTVVYQKSPLPIPDFVRGYRIITNPNDPEDEIWRPLKTNSMADLLKSAKSCFDQRNTRVKVITMNQ